jgi:hypothetical protein
MEHVNAVNLSDHQCSGLTQNSSFCQGWHGCPTAEPSQGFARALGYAVAAVMLCIHGQAEARMIEAALKVLQHERMMETDKRWLENKKGLHYAAKCWRAEDLMYMLYGPG